MPFWRRPYYYTRRWRHFRRRRARRPFRRRLRRRYYRVRRSLFKRKLKKFKIQQWQPSSIRKLKIEGTYQLFFTTNQRVDHNNTLYIDTISPHHVPSGGGFSLSQFTLQTLYDQHLRLRNWWTKSNEYLPLIKYMGCVFKLYYQENVDYIFHYENQFPMKCSRLCYNSTQPSVMRLMKHKRIMPCRKYNYRKRPYKKVRIRPPAQLTNQWYFQSDLANIPLVNIMGTAASLDRYYTPAQAKTPTISITCLDPTIWQNHNFKDMPTYGYQRKQGELLFGLQNGAYELSAISFKQLIFLANSCDYTQGTPLSSVTGTGQTKWQNWVTQKQWWGNPFFPDYFHQSKTNIIYRGDINTLRNYFSTNQWNFDKKLSEIGGFAFPDLKNFIDVRYNPYRDRGTGNEVYFLPVTNKATYGWEPPEDPKLIAKDLPLWTLFWGLVDWHKRANIVQSIETHYIAVFKTKYTNSTEPYFVLLGDYFLDGRSEYFPQDTQPQVTQSDLKNWHPKTTFQLDSINHICRTGPGVIRLVDNVSAECHVDYKFYFKLGGSPPPMEIISEPDKQPKWPLPYNFNDQPSLQSPTTPFQHFLYHFDQRGPYITKTAAKRLKTDFEPKETFKSITGTLGMDIPAQTPETSETEASEEEKDPQTIQEQLQQQLQLQHLLKQRIRKLMKQVSQLQ
nr:MAG: ORF1 [TTV-like mini virus]